MVLPLHLFSHATLVSALNDPFSKPILKLQSRVKINTAIKIQKSFNTLTQYIELPQGSYN